MSGIFLTLSEAVAVNADSGSLGPTGALFASRRLSLPPGIATVGHQWDKARRSCRLRTVEEPGREFTG
jgi:hypothetical protein